MEAVKEILEQFEQCFYPDVGAALHHYAMLDDARLESLISRWLPVATEPAPEVEKVGRNGQIYTQRDNETPAKAAAIVLGRSKAECNCSWPADRKVLAARTEVARLAF